ncbi:hypothetical protein T492DRAFT_354039 [Pavlovales sp. CCMP2436]|nr:hypothetical protein T492DRAFT_354039 [Pavlovales sp. CCMP2436]
MILHLVLNRYSSRHLLSPHPSSFLVCMTGVWDGPGGELPAHPLLRSAALAGRDIRAGRATSGASLNSAALNAGGSYAGNGGNGGGYAGSGGLGGAAGGNPSLYDKTHPLASPIFATDEQLRHAFPFPTHVLAAGLDPLLDDAVDFNTRSFFFLIVLI